MSSANADPSSSLLHELESILDSDPLIDEVGFVHPSQFAAIRGTSDDNIGAEPSEANHAEMAFLCKDHKLGISTHVIHPLYNAAKHALMSSLNQYKMVTGLHGTEMVLDTESEVMKHSKTVLLLSCDFGTAWNCRKEVVSKKQDVMLYFDELKLSSLVLSYSPKSERAWSHRWEGDG